MRLRAGWLTDAAWLSAVGWAVADARAGDVAVLAVGAAFAVLIAATEIVESGRWRLGARAAARRHLPAASLGVGLSAFALALAALADHVSVTSATIATVGLAAATVVTVVVALRVRRQ